MTRGETREKMMFPAEKNSVVDGGGADGRRPAGELDPRLTMLLGAHGPIPSPVEWDPVEAALYVPHVFGLPGEAAAALRYSAIHLSFAYHIQHNVFYRRYCEAVGVSPASLHGPEDLRKIPVIPGQVFRGFPSPEEFIGWLKSLSSDEIGWPALGALAGSYEDQVAALQDVSGIEVCSTTDPGGIRSFLPIDPDTRRRRAHWKTLTFFAMYPELLGLPDLISVALWPPDLEWAELIVSRERVHMLCDAEASLDTLLRAMMPTKPRGLLARVFGGSGTGEQQVLVETMVARLEELSSSRVPAVLWAHPSLLYALARFMRARQIRIELGEHWRIQLAGRWILSEQQASDAEQQTLVSETLGIPPTQIYSVYGSSEGLGLFGLSCNGGYVHIPHSVLHPLVLDEAQEPVEKGDWGRFAFLNPLTRAYPGFIVTEDRVRLWSRCPACKRTGPVLDPQISRMRDGNNRTCGDVVREIITDQLKS